VISIRVSGNRSIQPALEAILSAPPVDAWVVVLAGALRKSSPLRKLCETHKGAASIICYADSERDLDRIIDQETRAAGLAISPEARTALKNFIGSDRLASRSEIAKLCLYAGPSGRIDIDDVRAIIGDASALDVDEAIDAMALGDAAAFDRGYRRLVASGTAGSVIAGAALRHFNFLQRARAAVDDGASPETLLGRTAPQIFYRRQSAVARQITIWSSGKIERALAMLDQAMLDSRLRGAISDEVIGQAMAMIAAIPAIQRSDQRANG
jgi:DNA polymerase-3 subunit delta